MNIYIHIDIYIYVYIQTIMRHSVALTRIENNLRKVRSMICILPPTTFDEMKAFEGKYTYIYVYIAFLFCLYLCIYIDVYMIMSMYI
jgi:hypothetical protein